jgi:branched-chain amino acid aminotransferase
MSMAKTEWIWMNGKLVRWDDATIHVMSHVVHYGSSVFEGIRCYRTPEGPAVFRLHDHIRRLFNSARIYRMPLAITQTEVEDAIRAVIERDSMEECYVRPVVYRGTRCSDRSAAVSRRAGDRRLAVGPLPRRDSTAGVDIRVSSWRRLAPTPCRPWRRPAPTMNSQLIKLDALEDAMPRRSASTPTAS